MKDAGSIVSMDSSVAVEDLAQGLDWVRWMLRSVRHRCDGVVLERPDEAKAMRALWCRFAEDRFIGGLGAVLVQAWQASMAGNMDDLIALESAWAAQLTPDELKRSLAAGRLLLSSTRGARYQGPLGHLREAVEDGRALGQIGIVWPAVAQLFQLTPAALLAEYLHLEWETATRELFGVPAPRFALTIPAIVGRVLGAGSIAEPRVLRRRPFPPSSSNH